MVIFIYNKLLLFAKLSFFNRFATTGVILLFSLNIALAKANTIQFDHISIQDGLSQSTVTCLLQDNKGFVWIGTQDGLNKYDGYNFTIFHHKPDDSTSISGNYITAIHQDNDGYIWVGTQRGLNRLDPYKETFTPYRLHKGINRQEISAISNDKEGNIWIGTALGSIKCYSNNEKKFLTINPILANHFWGRINAIQEDNHNNIWIATTQQLLVFNSKTDQLKKISTVPFLEEKPSFKGLSKDKYGNIWVNANGSLYYFSAKTIKQKIYTASRAEIINNDAISAIYCHENLLWIGSNTSQLKKLIIDSINIDNQPLKLINYKTNTLHNEAINNILLDNSACLWLGTDRGVNKFDSKKQQFHHHIPLFDNAEQYQEIDVWSFSEAATNSLWISTSKGVCLFNEKIKDFEKHQKLNKHVTKVFSDHRNQLWLVIDGKLFMINNPLEKFNPKPILYSSSTIKNTVYDIAEPKNNTLWLGTKKGLYSYNPLLKTAQLITDSNIYDNAVNKIYIDKKGSFWLGTNNGLKKFLLKDNQLIFQSKNFLNLLNQDKIISICEDGDGYLWVGTYGGGVLKINNDSEIITRYTEKHGLANNVVYSCIVDEENNVWCSTNKGLTKINTTTKKFYTYQKTDGLQSDEFNFGAYYKSQNGNLYFGGINGFNEFNPSSIKANPLPPKMVFTDFKINNKPLTNYPDKRFQKHIAYTKEIELDYDENHFQIAFAALHYSSPSKNHYKYKLDGFDKEWIDANTKRSVRYANIGPGDYTFIVLGSNSDGVWSEAAASLKIIVLPPFWGTWWFRSIILLLIGSIIYAGVIVRIQLMKKQKETLQLLVKERTKEVTRQKEQIEQQKTALETEKRKADNLLLNILPENTVQELQIRGKARARSYGKATVMFTDIKNFTKISEEMRPKDLVAELDKHFSKCDEIIEKNNIEKIKTIGDSYMCAGGIPIRNKSNPIDVVLAGLEIQHYMHKLKLKAQHEKKNFWEVRIGIHTGPLIAGVIGKKRFAYDIWGDTVNTANRIEMSCEPGRVNISEKTYSLVKNFFDCEYRGKVEAKNKGEIDMYFINGIKPELSINKQGVFPNEIFWDYVNLELYSSISYNRSEKFLMDKLQKELPKNLYYHGPHHTIDVCEAVERIAKGEGIKGEELFLLKTAALYHDAGFIKPNRSKALKK